MEQTAALIEIKMRRQQILATEIDDGLMPGFALVVAIGLNDADVFVLDPPFATGGSDDPQEHGDPPPKLILRGSRHLRRFQPIYGTIDRKNCPYVFSKKAEPITYFQSLTRREIEQDVKHVLP